MPRLAVALVQNWVQIATMHRIRSFFYGRSEKHPLAGGESRSPRANAKPVALNLGDEYSGRPTFVAASGFHASQQPAPPAVVSIHPGSAGRSGATECGPVQWATRTNLTAPLAAQMQQVWPRAFDAGEKAKFEFGCIVYGETIAGMVRLEPCQPDPAFISVVDAASWLSLSLMVHPNHRGQGLGKALLDAACAKAVASGKIVYIADQTDAAIGLKLYGGKNLNQKYDVFHAIGKGGGRGQYLIKKKISPANHLHYLRVPDGHEYEFSLCQESAVGRLHLQRYIAQLPEEKARLAALGIILDNA